MLEMVNFLDNKSKKCYTYLKEIDNKKGEIVT